MRSSSVNARWEHETDSKFWIVLVAISLDCSVVVVEHDNANYSCTANDRSESALVVEQMVVTIACHYNVLRL